jgi:hypothetical protein
MAWLAVDKDGNEWIFENIPEKTDWCWCCYRGHSYVKLSKGSIKKLTGKTLTWDDEPIEI